MADSDLPNKVCDRINFTAICYEKECARGRLHSERKVLSPDFKGSEDAESFERIVSGGVFPFLEYGNKQSFSFIDAWTNETKTVNRLQKETL